MSSECCTDCGQPIELVKTAKGHRVPHDLDGTPHKRTCTGRHVHHKSARVAQDGERRARVKR
jgi:hypothetical protein